MKLTDTDTALINYLNQIWSTKKINEKDLGRNQIYEREQVRVVQEALQVIRTQFNPDHATDHAPVALVIGSALSSSRATEARQLGNQLATNGWVLVTGGRGGVMQQVTEGYMCSPKRRLALGIIPQDKKPVRVEGA